MIGDANVALNQRERSSGPVAKKEYRDFLRETNGQDAWENDVERSAEEQFMCHKNGGYSIIDRIATSKGTVIEAQISTITDDFIPHTDHRPIWGNVTIQTPRVEVIPRQARGRDPTNQAGEVRRIKFPYKEDQGQFSVFREKAEQLVTHKELEKPIKTDAEFDRVYGEMTDIIVGEARTIFGTRTVWKRDLMKEIRTLK